MAHQRVQQLPFEIPDFHLVVLGGEEREREREKERERESIGWMDGWSVRVRVGVM